MREIWQNVSMVTISVVMHISRKKVSAFVLIHLGHIVKQTDRSCIYNRFLIFLLQMLFKIIKSNWP